MSLFLIFANKIFLPFTTKNNTPMTIIETERILLQEANLEDAAFIFELVNSPGWLEFISDKGLKTLADAEEYIKSRLISSYQKYNLGLYKMVLKESNKAIGLCGLISRPSLPNVDIGFAILPEYGGNGYTFEAGKAVMEYGASQLGFKTILGTTAPDNIKSQKLLEKLGLRLVETIQMGDYEGDTLLYSNEV